MPCQLPLGPSSKYRSTPARAQQLQETQQLVQQELQLHPLLLHQASKPQLPSRLQLTKAPRLAVLQQQQARRQVAARREVRQTPSMWSKPAMHSRHCCNH